MPIDMRGGGGGGIYTSNVVYSSPEKHVDMTETEIIIVINGPFHTYNLIMCLIPCLSSVETILNTSSLLLPLVWGL